MHGPGNDVSFRYQELCTGVKRRRVNGLVGHDSNRDRTFRVTIGIVTHAEEIHMSHDFLSPNRRHFLKHMAGLSLMAVPGMQFVNGLRAAEKNLKKAHK